MNGFYNDTLLDAIRSGPDRIAQDIDWMILNRIDPGGLNYCAYYHNRELLAHRAFPGIVAELFDNGIRVGVPFSTVEEVKQGIAYNNQQDVDEQKISFFVSEIEDYTAGGLTPQYFRDTLIEAYQLAQSFGIPLGVYQGWSKEPQYETIIAHSDFLFLHAYRPSALMQLPRELFNYCSDRLGIVAKYAERTGKRFPVSIIFSCEPQFGMEYFKVHPWNSAFQVFIRDFNRYAPKQMKEWVDIVGIQIYSSHFGQIAKPDTPRIFT